MAFQKGHKRLGGIKKGQKTKATLAKIEIAEMIRTALDDLGGVEYLKARAVDTPQAFMGLLGKIIPADINAKINGKMQIEIIKAF